MATLRSHKHILDVAKYCFDRFGDDYYEAINATESITGLTDDVKSDAVRVHAILEGEL